jgi:H+/Cl- antiporter ClcA
VTRSPVTWPRALRALAVACALVLVLTFVAANFVLVDVRLWGLSVETRLAWAAVVPAALGFAAGMLFSRTRGAGRSPGSTPPAAVTNGSDVAPPEPDPPRP